MSMDEFGFFSEAADSAAPSASSYASSSSTARAFVPSHHSSSYHEYQQYHDQHQSQPLPMQQAHSDYQSQRQYQYQHQSQSQHQHQHIHQHQHLAPQQQHPHRLSNRQARSDSSSAGTNSGSQGFSAPAKRGSNLACLKCRAIKVKCWKSNPNDPRCARCNRLDLFCEFREHHRGKKLEKVIADENRNVVLSPDMLRRARQHMLRCSSYPVNVDLATMMTAEGAEDPSQYSFQSGMPSQQYASSFSFQEYNTASSASSSMSTPAIMASSVYDDVVRMNGCTWADACYLFSLFSTQLNPIVALMEPNLHTVQYTREQSPILFSAILDVASRFFRPDLHQQCQQAAAAIFKFASNRKLCSIDHIQALIVSAIWAPPGDTARSDMLAQATAYAYELGLPFCFEAGVAVSSAIKPYTPPMPMHLLHGGHQSTVLRMQQRTWIQLCMLVLSEDSDTRCKSAHKRPEAIAPADFPNVRAWYELNNSTMSAYDTRLAYQFDFALSQRSFNHLVKTANPGHGQQATSSLSSEGDLERSFESLLLQERECFSTWFNMYGDEYVARYGMDRYSNAEAGYFLLVYRFVRAVQLHSIASRSSAHRRAQAYNQSFDSTAATTSKLEERWFATATDLAFKVLEAFNSKVLDQDATSSSMLRLSPQYMASACLSAARWLLREDVPAIGQQHPSTIERARERVSEVIRLLAQPQFYPDGNRVPTSGELTGQLDQALRSLMGDRAMLVAFQSGTSPKRARAQDTSGLLAYTPNQQGRRDKSSGQDWQDEQSRKQRRRTSSGSLVRIELGSVGGRSVGGLSESAGSERGGSQWSPYMTAEKWNTNSSSGYVSGPERCSQHQHRSEPRRIALATSAPWCVFRSGSSWQLDT